MVGLGQQGSQAVGLGFESLPCQKSLRFILNIFRYPKVVKLALRQKIFGGKSWYSPLPLIHKLFGYRKYSETQHRRVPLPNFSAAWDKKFLTENRDTPSLPPPPPLIHKFFQYQKFWETQKCSSTKFFGAVRQKLFDRKSWYSLPPLLSLTFSDNRNFLKHRRVPQRNFPALSDENFSRENRDTLLHKVQKSVVELICKNSLETNIKTVVLFLTNFKNWSKYL